jgi:hypothetical protein
MTLGNFSDALMRRDMSKMSIGFLQDATHVSTELLLKHLLTRPHFNYSRSSALKAIQQFGLYLEHQFWEMFYAPLIQYEETGVQMYILGRRGLQTIFPVLAYSVGDDPALHRYTLIYEGNANHSCIRCMYSVRQHGMFNPLHQHLRDHGRYAHMQRSAQASELKKLQRIPLSGLETLYVNQLKDACVHPIMSGTVGVPMGFTAYGTPNTVFRSPCDILHTFECGLFKNITLWVVSMSLNISKMGHAQFRHSPGLLDARIASMRDFCRMPNVTMSYFRKGITYISKHKTARQKSNTTGGAGGFRSCEYVAVTLQMYFAVSLY